MKRNTRSNITKGNQQNTNKSKSRSRNKKKVPVPEKAVWWLHLEKHPIYAALGAVIRMLRKARGWSLLDLHQATRMAYSYLGCVEKGRYVPSVEVMLRIEAVFGLERGSLLHLAGQKVAM
ncbi:MAG TPA: helix-turn-helix transcriptional regulator [Fimbriimonas sp.]|nr:helix-turn-helix transcriptional regulator [Fimbriimonas sp.]